MRRFAFLLLLFFILCFSFLTPQPVQAQIGSASDLIDAVNAVRIANGLEPYVVDAGLMAIAQEHSEYQASIGEFTHTRADGSGPGDHGISSENIGGGMNASPQQLIQYQWRDYWHTHTLVGYTSGLVGAGVAVVDGLAYYTLDVRNTGTMSGLPAEATEDPSSDATDAAAGGTAFQMPAQITSTPNEDGSVLHTVQLGETLWSIAEMYGSSVDDLISLNSLSATDPVIYEGQDLVVRLAYTRTPTPTITMTPTKTLRPTRTPRPLEATFTLAAPYATTAAPLIPETNRKPSNLQSVGMLVVIVSALGLIGVFVSRWWSKKVQ